MLVALAAAAIVSELHPVALIPKPMAMTVRQGAFHIDRDTVIVADPGARNAARLASEQLGLKVAQSAKAGIVRFKTGIALQPEGYCLTVTPKQVLIESRDDAGAYYGLQTLRQLIHDRSVPAVEIADEPRFAWRGFHLDVSRHFYTASEVKKLIDVLARLKLNVFHWHLVDDGGWRLEIKKYPKLTSVGAWRQGERWSYTDIKIPGSYGGFYTQDEVKDVVAYAKARHVTVVPEIELPGHTFPSVVAYPNLKCDVSDELYKTLGAVPGANVYCAGKEDAFRFLSDVFDEVVKLFPSKYVHIGGDEVIKQLWETCPDCRRRMKNEGLKTPEELQSYFIRRVAKMLEAKGKKVIGWDEILEGGLAPGAAVMSWRGEEGGIAAAKAGHDVVMTPINPCYFDWAYEPNLERAFRWDPIPAALSPEEAKHVLGLETCTWSEWLPTMKDVEFLEFPGTLGIAETAWSRQDGKDWADFSARVEAWLPALDEQGIGYYVAGPSTQRPIVFLGSGRPVEFDVAPGRLTRYTTDGSEPKADSPVYTGPLPVDRPTTVRAASFVNGRRHSLIADVRVLRAPQPPVGLVPGLKWRHAQGRWGSVPSFEGLRADGGTSLTPDLGPWGDAENYAVQFDGWIEIPRVGRYTLYLGSDDGSRLDLAGVNVIDNDGLHGYAVKSVTLDLPRGPLPISIGFVQAAEAAKLTLEIEGPGMPRQSVPASMFERQG